MGMYDESWCASCGAGLPYSEEDVTCGECVTEDTDKSKITLINYIRLHILSLQQDLENELYLFRTNRDNHDTSKIDYLNGQLVASMHLLSVVHDILGETNNEGEE